MWQDKEEQKQQNNKSQEQGQQQFDAGARMQKNYQELLQNYYESKEQREKQRADAYELLKQQMEQNECLIREPKRKRQAAQQVGWCDPNLDNVVQYHGNVYAKKQQLREILDAQREIKIPHENLPVTQQKILNKIDERLKQLQIARIAKHSLPETQQRVQEKPGEVEALRKNLNEAIACLETQSLINEYLQADAQQEMQQHNNMVLQMEAAHRSNEELTAHVQQLETLLQKNNIAYHPLQKRAQSPLHTSPRLSQEQLPDLQQPNQFQFVEGSQHGSNRSARSSVSGAGSIHSRISQPPSSPRVSNQNAFSGMISRQDSIYEPGIDYREIEFKKHKQKQQDKAAKKSKCMIY